MKRDLDFRAFQKELVQFRRYFHRHPELSLEEYETSSTIKRHLESWGYQIQEVPPTGLIATLMKDPGLKTVVVRAEMDALPITEKTGLSYASLNKDVMHACGHDGILAAAIVLARILAQEKEYLDRNIRFLFEPAEEIGEGAKRMIEAGALDVPGGCFGESKKADAFLMFHYVSNDPFGLAIHDGQASSVIGAMELRVHGKSSHWCEAEKGTDAILAAAKVVESVHEINQKYQGEGPFIVGLGTISGGKSANIIADLVTMKGNIRAFYEADYKKLVTLIRENMKTIEVETGVKIEMILKEDPVLPLINDKELTKTGSRIGKEIWGNHFVLEGDDKIYLSGDNAYRYFQQVRGLFTVFLAGKEKAYPLHHPQFDFDEEVLSYSLETLYRLVLEV